MGWELIQWVPFQAGESSIPPRSAFKDVYLIYYIPNGGMSFHAEHCFCSVTVNSIEQQCVQHSCNLALQLVQ